ncbi:hypothetical protein ACSVHC_07275 [Arthrobacter sp. KNU-44]|uniref:hypothetical protein n=1 Tax=Arthrobacter sp. KNU-44 TaxID=3450744 RepID=UPI003F439DA9
MTRSPRLAARGDMGGHADPCDPFLVADLHHGQRVRRRRMHANGPEDLGDPARGRPGGSRRAMRSGRTAAVRSVGVA